MSKTNDTRKYSLENLDCPGCAAKIQNLLQDRSDVRLAIVDFSTKSLKLEAVDHAGAIADIRRAHPGVVPVPMGEVGKEDEEKSYYDLKKEGILLVVAAVCMLAGFLLPGFLAASVPGLGWLPPAVSYAAFGMAWIAAGLNVASASLRVLSKGISLDENFLMVIASLGAFALGESAEGAAVMVFYKIGEILQERAIMSSRRSLRALLALKPDKARVLRNGREIDAKPESLVPGDIVRVRPGERIPADGTAVSGSGSVDASTMTGESIPLSVARGDELSSGFIALDAAIDLIVTRPASESGAARIVALVERAAASKAKTEKFITTFARWYTPAVVVAAVLLATLPPLLVPGQAFSEWLHRALVLLVISCPCALVVSVPLAYFGGIGGAARRGILIKGATAIDALARAKSVVFDKTGTLTEGNFTVRSVKPAAGFEARDTLALAFAAEERSNHPVAGAIRRAFEATAVSKEVRPDGEFREEGGFGVTAIVGGRRILAGSPALLEREGVVGAEGATLPLASKVGEAARSSETIVHIAVDGAFAGTISLGDTVKADARSAVSALSRLGVESVMMTGDTAGSASSIGEAVGIGNWKAGLLPGDKMSELERIIAANGKRSTVFVGDGVNDAPALARADVGIAMGAGSDAACESADLVLVSSSPSLVAQAIARARKASAIVRQNIVFSLAVKAAFLSLGAVGISGMWEAVIADVGVALVAVLNSLRALR